MLSADASHLRKYLATLGVAIVVGAISLASLVMRLPEELLVKQTELADLTPIARDTIERRQRYASVVTDLVPFLLLLGCMIGIGLTIYGIVGWTRRQAVSDEIEDLARDKSRTEVRRMTDLERRARLEKEAASAVFDDGTTDAPTHDPSPPSSPTDGSPLPTQVTSPRADALRHAVLMERVAEVEFEVIAKAEQALHATHRMDIGVRATVNGRVWQFDAVAYPVETRRRAVVFEVKYMTSPASVRARIQDAVGHAAAGAEILPGGAIPVVVAVCRDGTMTEQALVRARREAVRGAHSFNNRPRTLVLSEKELEDMSPESFAAAVGLRWDA